MFIPTKHKLVRMSRVGFWSVGHIVDKMLRIINELDIFVTVESEIFGVVKCPNQVIKL